MKIDEAIKEQQFILMDWRLAEAVRGKAAIKLGIEALKRIKAIRNVATCYPSAKLPGETK